MSPEELRVCWEKMKITAARGQAPTGMLASQEPPFWVDINGNWRPTLTEERRIRSWQRGSAADLWDYISRRDGGRCVICSSRADVVMDHIISRRNGGSHHPANLMMLCCSCNARKAATIDILPVGQQLELLGAGK